MVWKSSQRYIIISCFDRGRQQCKRILFLMRKAHKAILDSLRQKIHRQPLGVQTKEIQSFEIRVDLCWDDIQPALLQGAGTASQLHYPKQTASKCPQAIPPHSPWAGEPLCQGEESPGTWLTSSLGHIKPTRALSAGLGGPCCRGVTSSQPQWFEMRTDVWLWALGWDPSLVSNTDRFTVPLQCIWWSYWFQWEF